MHTIPHILVRLLFCHHAPGGRRAHRRCVGPRTAKRPSAIFRTGRTSTACVPTGPSSGADVCSDALGGEGCR